MGSNVSRWLKYAKAKLDDTVSSGNRELDRREAKLEAERADKPWLGAEDDAPTLDEARARIRWEQERQGAPAGDHEAEPSPGTDAPAEGPAATGPSGNPAGPVSSVAPSPHDPSAAEQATARIELEARQRESAARLDQIRRELGVEPAEPPPTT